MSLQTHRSHTGAVAQRPVLAPHLQETIESLAAGETAREMAARLYISPNTVKSRLKTLYQQLGARDQAHAVAIGFRIGVLRPPGEADPGPGRQPVMIGTLDPDSLRDTIAELTALLRIVERVRQLDGGHLPELLRQVGELASRPHDDPEGALARIAEIAAEAGFGVDGEAGAAPGPNGAAENEAGPNGAAGTGAGPGVAAQAGELPGEQARARKDGAEYGLGVNVPGAEAESGR